MRPSRPALRAASAALAALAATGATWALPKESAVWLEVRSAHFTLLGDLKEKRLREIASDLETFRSVLDQATGLTLESPRPTYVFVFGRTPTFQQYTTGVGSKVTTGYFVGSPEADYLAIDAEDPGDAFGVLYHEYVHKALAATFPSVPVWLNEGLAEFYSTFRCVKNEVETGRPVRDHVAWLATHPLMPLDKLFAVTEKSEEYNEREKVGVFYAESWALVHMLLRGDSAKRAGANAFLASMLRDEPPEDAVRRAFGIGLADLQRELQSYVQRTKFTFAILTIDGLRPAAPGEALPLSRGDYLARLGDLLYVAQHGNRTPAAEEHYRAALALDPESARANAGLAKLRAEEGKHAEAETLYGKALAKAPEDASILYFAGLEAIEKLRASGRLETVKGDDPDWLRARGLFDRCVAAAPENGDAAAMAGLTYLVAEGDPGRGIELLEAAASRMPKRSDVLYGLVVLHARKRERDPAEQALGKLLVVGSPDQIASAREVLLDLDLEESDEAAARGDFPRSLELLRSVSEATTDASLKERIQERIAQIGGFAAERRDVDRFNAVGPLVEAGKWPAAREALRALLADCVTERICDAARGVLERIPKD